MNKVLLKLFLLISVFALGLGAKADDTYTITFGSVPSAGGTVTATKDNVEITSGSSVEKGASVRFTQKANSGYVFEGWYFDENCEDRKATDPIITLKNIEVNASVYAKYVKKISNITLAASSEYTIELVSGAPEARAEYGATVTFKVTPADGYFLKLIVLKDANDNAVAFTKNSDGTYSFTMPTADVTISAAATPTVSGVKGTDYTVDDDGNITILSSGLTVTGTLEGNLIIKNTVDGGTMNITFDNVQTLSSSGNWKSSIIISNTGNVDGIYGRNYPKINISFKGVNAFVNNSAPGFIINPDVTNDKPCDVYFSSIGQAVFYIGSNNSGYKALKDSLEEKNGLRDRTAIYVAESTKFDLLNYSKSIVTDGNEPSWTLDNIKGTSSAFLTFITSCKTDYQFVKFTMNQKSDSRTAPAGWLTICYPYSGTVTNGTVYEVFGRVMWEEGDPDMTESRGELGRLKHLVLKLRDDKTTFEAGKPYFVKKKSGQTDVMFTIDENSTYTNPIKFKGFVGVYDQKTMEPESFFLSGSQMAQVRPNSTQNLIPAYRAYFPWVSKTENFLALVPEYYKIIEHGETYLVYGHASGTGGTNSGTDYDTKIRIDEVEILGEDETTEIMNIVSEKKIVSSQYYDLMGRKVQTPKKGSLYIVNGKKILF